MDPKMKEWVLLFDEMAIKKSIENLFLTKGFDWRCQDLGQFGRKIKADKAGITDYVEKPFTATGTIHCQWRLISWFAF